MSEATDLVKAAGVSMICNSLMTPLFLDGLFLEWTQRMYSDPRNLLPRVKPWLGAKAADSVFIVTTDEWLPTQVNRSPAIVVEVSTLTFDDERYGAIGNTDTHSDKGSRDITDSITGQVVWTCFGESYGMSRLYSSNTMALLRAFSTVMAREFNFEKLRLASVTAPEKKKDAPELYQSQVIAKFVFSDTVTLQHEAPLLKRVNTLVETPGLSPKRI